MELIMYGLLLVLLVGLMIVWVGFASSMLLTSRFELKKRAQAGNKKAQVYF